MASSVNTGSVYGTAVYGTNSYGVFGVVITVDGVQGVATTDPDIIITADATHSITSVQGVVTNGGVGDVLAKANTVPTGVEATVSVGVITQRTVNRIPVTGISATSTIGTTDVIADSNTTVGSVSATTSVDSVVITASSGVPTTGVEATASPGTVTISDSAQPTFTGVSATGTAGDVTISETQNVFDVANRSAVRLARVPPAPPRIVYVGRAA